MKKHELSQLFYLKKETEHLKMRISELECAATSQTPRIMGMPRAPGFPNKVGKYASEIAELKSLLDINLKRCFRELIKLNSFIESIESSQMRLIMNLRYINGLTWQEVASRMGEADEQYPRRKHNAFLKMQKSLEKSSKDDENNEAKVVK
jgi:hypothetical protein